MARPLLILMLMSVVAVAAPVPKALKAKAHVGEWKVEFENGVVEACSITGDSKTAVAEPLRASGGQAETGSGGVVVLKFDDDRTERWTPDGEGYAVEHWCPSNSYPASTPVRGIAKRK